MIVFIGVIVYISATIIITRWRRNLREVSNKHDNEFHDRATDSIINFETVKYFTAEDFELKRFNTSITSYQTFNSSTKVANSILNITQQIVLSVTLLGSMILASKAVIDGEMSIGNWIAVQSWVTTIFVPLNFLGGIYNAIIQALIDIKNLSELLSEEPDIIDEVNAIDIPYSKIPAAIQSKQSKIKNTLIKTNENESIRNNNGISVEFKNVSFNYLNQPIERGLNNIDFIIQPGTTTAIVGSTGSGKNYYFFVIVYYYYLIFLIGKTTLSRLLFRFYDPKIGTILLNNYNIKNYTQKSVRKMIGVVPQDTVLFNDTILYNIQYGNRDATIEQVKQAAESAQIRQFIESLPDSWETMVGERGLKLSGGEVSNMPTKLIVI